MECPSEQFPIKPEQAEDELLPRRPEYGHGSDSVPPVTQALGSVGITGIGDRYLYSTEKGVRQIVGVRIDSLPGASTVVYGITTPNGRESASAQLLRKNHPPKKREK